MQQYVMCKFTLKLQMINLAIGTFEETKGAIPPKRNVMWLQLYIYFIPYV